MDKYKNKYRIPSARAQWWDYGWNGAYFITICTQNREYFFGEIRDGKMILSHLGLIAGVLWHEIPNHAKFVELGDFVVMPNHIHGILILNKPDGANDNVVSGSHTDTDTDTDTDIDTDTDTDTDTVETLHATSLQMEKMEKMEPTEPMESMKQSDKNHHMAKISPKSNSVSTIIRSYKSAVTKHANRLGLENGWQPRFHDHIIRNDAEYQRISDYIINNPAKWRNDKFFIA